MTTRFDLAIAALNHRFGTCFSAPDPRGVLDREAVFAAIEARNAARYGRVTEAAVARPSPLRQAVLDRQRAQLELPEVRRNLERARAARAVLLAETGV